MNTLLKWWEWIIDIPDSIGVMCRRMKYKTYFIAGIGTQHGEIRMNWYRIFVHQGNIDDLTYQIEKIQSDFIDENNHIVDNSILISLSRIDR